MLVLAMIGISSPEMVPAVRDRRLKNDAAEQSVKMKDNSEDASYGEE